MVASVINERMARQICYLLEDSGSATPAQHDMFIVNASAFPSEAAQARPWMALAHQAVTAAVTAAEG
jgi:hypothetical protein